MALRVAKSYAALVALAALLTVSPLLAQEADKKPTLPPELKAVVEKAPVRLKANQFPGVAVSYTAMLIDVEDQKYQLSLTFADGERAFLKETKPETVMLVQEAFAHPDRLGVIAFYTAENGTIHFLMVYSLPPK